MGGPGTPQRPDFQSMAAMLRLLAHAPRLELLDQLRMPKMVSDLRMAPSRPAGGSPARPASRQAVQAHLDSMVEAGFVDEDSVPHGGLQRRRYRVNGPRLYGFVESLRRLSTQYAGHGSGFDETVTQAGGRSDHAADGARLTLVHGAYEGKSVALQGDGPWTIGRADADMTLDYDGYLSAPHATIHLGDRGYAIEDTHSKNGTHVNWIALSAGQPRVLRAGDVIGVGTSILVFAA